MAVLFEKRGKVAYVTLNRPEVLNAMNQEMFRELAEAWTRIQGDDGVRVAILSGAGRAFSAGADMKEAARRASSAGGPPSASTPGLLREIELWKPVVAAIQGHCYGAGLELALSCDFRIAAESARFGIPEVFRAIVPILGLSQRLPRYLPFGVALDMCVLGDDLMAQDAYRLGFVKKVVPQEQLMEEAEALAQRLLALSPLTVRAIKEAMYRSLNNFPEQGEHLVAHLARMVRESDDGREGPRAFAEKRPPVWKSR